MYLGTMRLQLLCLTKAECVSNGHAESFLTLSSFFSAAQSIAICCETKGSSNVRLERQGEPPFPSALSLLYTHSNTSAPSIEAMPEICRALEAGIDLACPDQAISRRGDDHGRFACLRQQPDRPTTHVAGSDLSRQ